MRASWQHTVPITLLRRLCPLHRRRRAVAPRYWSTNRWLDYLREGCKPAIAIQIRELAKR